MNLNRFELLVGKELLSKISNLNILLIGVGGVGGYALESLVRSGINNITIIDNDIIDETNLNRQIISNTSNIGLNKVDEAVKRAILINKSINAKGINLFVDETNIETILNQSYDYVVDACDTLNTKALIIKECYKKKLKLISSMGTANKFDSLKVQISTLDKTKYCVLAKKLRRLVSKEEMKYTNVVYSTEECLKLNGLGSSSYLPAIFGLLITDFIINNERKSN